MRWTMYHKNIPTIIFEATDFFRIDKILTIENAKHIHPSLLINGNVPTEQMYFELSFEIKEWVKHRQIPSCRQNISCYLSDL